MTRTSRRRVAGTITLLALAAVTGASVQWTASAQDGRKGGGRRGPRRPVPQAAGGGSLIRLELKEEATPGSEDMPSRPPLAPATPLSDEDTAKVLARLAAIAPEAGADFALREGSLPPPRTGKTVESPFPPPPSKAGDETGPPRPDAPPAGPLEVLRHQPDGEVPIAPRFSITFNQPMVAVTSHKDTVQAIPVKLTPEIAGEWRWVGTKTLLFEPKPRFPMATVYTATVPAGTASAIGGKLAADATFSFSTPPIKLEASSPQGGSNGLTPVFYASFDQAIDPAAVLAKARLEGGRGDWGLRLATQEEIDADPVVKSWSSNAQEKRWLAFRCTTTLPKATGFRVVFGKGTPSAEGPRTTAGDQGYSFQTYGPLQITHKWPEHEAPPWNQWSIQFSNALDSAKFTKDLVKIEPKLEGAKIACGGNGISISGATKGRTTYKVTVGANLTDVFGQTLGSDQTVEFKVGSAPEAFWGTEGLVVLDPQGSRSYSLYSVNEKKLKVRAFAVKPEDWAAFHAVNMKWQQDRVLERIPGKCVLEDTVKPKGEADSMTETLVDLSEAFDGGLGHALVIVEPMEQPKEPWQRRAIIAWVESTKLAVDAFVDHREMLAWVSQLKDGRPVADAQVTLAPWGIQATTGKDGTASLSLGTDGHDQAFVVARSGKDSALLPEQLGWWGSGTSWIRSAPSDSLRWWVADDRHLYRPGEEVHLKGWLRRFGKGPAADLEPLAGAAKTVRWVLHDSQGNEVLKGSQPVSALGGWDAAFTLPPTMNLGSSWMQLWAEGGNLGSGFNHVIEVQEFRRPEFEVSASASAGPVLVGDHASLTVAANYYSGGPLPGADVTWNLQCSEGSYAPPGHGEYSFGIWVPWWESWNGGGGGAWFQNQGKTDPSGKHTLGLDLLGLEHARPVVISASAQVMDVNRQAWSSSASILVHPASEYVGLRSPRTFVQKGEPLAFDAIVADLEGKVVTGRKVSIKAVRLDWDWEDGRYVNKETDPFEATLDSAKDPVRTTFTPKEGGTYRVRARIEDPKGRANESELTLWVAGGKTQPSRNVEMERVTLVPDKREYAPGETAEILVMAPFPNAEALVSLERLGFLGTQRVTLDGSSTTIKVPVVDAHTPNLHVRVDLVGQAPRLTDAGVADPKLPPRPAFAVGELDLRVPPTARKLALDVKPRESALVPGGETTVDVSLKDAGGKPVEGGEVALVVVDEAVLALSGYRLPDLLAAFYPELPSGVSQHYLRPHVLLANPEDALKQAAEHANAAQDRDGLMMEKGGAPGAGAAAPAPVAARAKKAEAFADEAKDASGGGGAGAAIAVRTNFNALALFAAALPTDANGHAEIKLKLPDSLTRYRLMAVGVAGDRQFGQGESQITARLPLMVRPSPPRFLNFGDQFELPVVVQNQTDAPLTVDVAVRAANCALTGAKGLRVQVPANDRVEVRFPAAAQRAGKARFQFGAASGAAADAAELTLPVWTPATTEAFATYGEIDEGAIVQPVAMPGVVVKEFGGLEVETSSTAVQALTDAVLYLVRYPFECSEQLSSRVLAVAALKDVLGAFHAEGLPPPEEITESVKKDLQRLSEVQGWDGGFAFWRRGDPEWPYLSIHVAHALARAKAKGFEVPADMLQRSHNHLNQIEAYIPATYGRDYKRMLVAYSLYVRKLLGDVDAKKARAVMAEGGLATLSLEATGWLLSVLSGDKGSQAQVAEIRKFLENRVTEEAGTAHWTTSYGDGAYLLLASDRRTDGVLLDALIEDSPKSDLIPKVVRGLLAHRKAGHWANTNENAFVLLALDRYFDTYEKETPDFVARAWLGDRLAGEHTFKGRTTERAAVKVPMSYLAEGDPTKPLTIAKEGPGRLYYRVGMRYAPASLSLEPSDHGFTVTRAYEAVEKPEDVKKGDDGVWHVRAGAQVRVRVTMVAPTRRYHVALVDPLPAGLEAMNPALAVTGPVPQESSPQRGWWWGPWFEHQNLRDERAEAFTSLLWEGVHEYVYVCRATTPGTFVVPPAKAEEMYEPETFGRSGTDRLVVEAK